MKVTVAGLWHLGTVTAACCASGGHDVIAFDEDTKVVADLNEGRLPVDEPGLAEMVASAVKAGHLRFTSEMGEARVCDVLWICYDTPVDEHDVANTEYVLTQVKRILASLKEGAIVLISSQLPVGSTAALEDFYPQFDFAYSPENLRLGKAIEVFTNPDRVVIGTRKLDVRERLTALFAPFTERLEWMSIESAEMTKHALNAFLATSVAFINEIATLCERTGADGQEVERGLKSDIRIGNKAYLHPGGAFAGGTLARDVSFLIAIGKRSETPTHLFSGVMQSNAEHRSWTQQRLTEELGSLRGRTIATLGLTYKPGTNTLRRSSAVEVCRWLLREGAEVRAFDPAIHELPEDLRGVRLMKDAGAALAGAEAVLVATPWPEFLELKQSLFLKMHRAIVLDPARFLEKIVAGEKNIEYYGIGISR